MARGKVINGIGQDAGEAATQALKWVMRKMKSAAEGFARSAEPSPSIASLKEVEPREMASKAISTVGTAASSGANSCLPSEEIVTTGMFATATVLSEETPPESSATEAGIDVDEALKAGSTLTRSNPTAAILVKVDSANALKYQGSMLYQDEKGKWVVDFV